MPASRSSSSGSSLARIQRRSVDQSTSRLGEQSAAEALDYRGELERLSRNYAAFAQRAKAERTISEYSAQWRRFSAWCAARGLEPLPCEPHTLALYLSDRAATLKVASLAMALAAIANRHKSAGLAQPQQHPRIAELWSGIRRSLGSEQRRVSPLLPEDLLRMSRALPHTLAGKRDRALLVIGLAGALRRSELVALELGDIQFAPSGGIVLRIGRSKVDQEGRGSRIGLARGRHAATCPERTLRAWLEAARIRSGPVFRRMSAADRVLGGALTGQSVAKIIKRRCRAAGLDPSIYSGHSLRAGLATSAARAGKGDRAIMRQGRWSGRSMVDRYVREARLLDPSNASADIGL